MKNELKQSLEQLGELRKKIAETLLEESSVKPGDIIEFGLNVFVGVLESRVVFREDGRPEIRLLCCEFTRTEFLGELTSHNTAEYDLPSLGDVKVVGKFTYELPPPSANGVKIIRLLTITLDRR